MTILAYLRESALPEYCVLTRHLWGVILTGELSTHSSLCLPVARMDGILFLFHAAAAAAAASLEIAVFYVSRNGLSPPFRSEAASRLG